MHDASSCWVKRGSHCREGGLREGRGGGTWQAREEVFCRCSASGPAGSLVRACVLPPAPPQAGPGPWAVPPPQGPPGRSPYALSSAPWGGAQEVLRGCCCEL